MKYLVEIREDSFEYSEAIESLTENDHRAAKTLIEEAVRKTIENATDEDVIVIVEKAE